MYILRSVSLCITLLTKKNSEIKFGKLFVNPISISYTQMSMSGRQLEAQNHLKICSSKNIFQHFEFTMEFRQTLNGHP